MKRILCFLVILMVLVPVHRVAADVGPKPSLVVRVVGAEAPEGYYLDLLVAKDFSGIPAEGEQGWFEEDQPWIVDLPIYQYDDGNRVGLLCHGWGIHGDLNGERDPAGYILHSFSYMNIPRTFAILYQNRETGQIVVSNTVTTSQYDALVRYDLGTNRLSVLRNTFGIWWWLQLLIRIFLTTMVECLLILFFRFPKRRWLPIPVNLITQGVLNLALVVLLPRFFQTDYLLAFTLMEVGITLIEFLAYYLWMAERRFWKAFLYALVANGMTLVIGLWWLS